jgi:hypothetical protein
VQPYSPAGHDNLLQQLWLTADLSLSRRNASGDTPARGVRVARKLLLNFNTMLLQLVLACNMSIDIHVADKNE